MSDKDKPFEKSQINTGGGAYIGGRVRINQAYQDAPDATEQKLLGKMRRQHRKVVAGEW